MVYCFRMICGHDPAKQLDAIFINTPLKDYDHYPRRNNFTLPVLGMAYIATYARTVGFNVGVLDGEALGLGVSGIVRLLNDAMPRWIGMNLLAPTYPLSVSILRGLSPDIQVMLGGHQAKAMPNAILLDGRIPRIDALVLGEGELRVAKLLQDASERDRMPNVFWRKSSREFGGGAEATSELDRKSLAPDLNQLPFLRREFLVQDPFSADDGRLEANLVGSRGCPYDCSFCGAAKSANPDISIRTRDPENILSEMHELASLYGVSAFRFVDDLFLASPQFIRQCLPLFIRDEVGRKWVWDATGRINVLASANGHLLWTIKEAGCREVALGIESGSSRLLEYIDKRVSPEMIFTAVQRLTAIGISVKGYFIIGFPTETEAEMLETIKLIRKLWDLTEGSPGHFRCSIFEFRPYPGTPEWKRLLASGKYSSSQLLNYQHVDFTDDGKKLVLLDRDEFNFSVNLQFGEVPVERVREVVAGLTQEQKQRGQRAERVLSMGLVTPPTNTSA